MIFKYKVTPSKVEATTKQGLIDKITRGHISTLSSEFGNAYRSIYSQRNPTVIVFNLEKRNKKTKQTKDKSGKTIKIKVLEPAKWVAYVYTFKIEMLNLFNLTLEQKKRNFTITKRK